MAEISTYKTQVEAVEFLNARGFKVRRTKFGYDLKKGLISKEKNGFTESALLAYAVAVLDSDKKEKDQEAAAKFEDKISADTRLKTAQAERQELKLQAEKGKFIEREKYEIELALRVQFFSQEIDNFVRSSATKIITFVRGDESMTTDLIKFMLSEKEAWLDAFSSDREFVLPETL